MGWDGRRRRVGRRGRGNTTDRIYILCSINNLFIEENWNALQARDYGRKKSGVYAAVDRLDPTVVTVEDLYFLGARKAN